MLIPAKNPYSEKASACIGQKRGSNRKDAAALDTGKACFQSWKQAFAMPAVHVYACRNYTTSIAEVRIVADVKQGDRRFWFPIGLCDSRIFLFLYPMYCDASHNWL